MDNHTDTISAEIIRQPVQNCRCALFDFDGTVSLIREGWQQVMIPYFCEVLEGLGTGESPGEIYQEVKGFVDGLTGKQTIFQCMALNEAVIRRGGPERDPGEYKAEYLRRLEEKIAGRKEALLNSTASPDDYSVTGARDFVRALCKAGIKCYLASGTDEEAVKNEASLLRIDDAFSGGIFGAREALTDCSKEAVIKRLIEEENLDPAELLGFGDGFVEIQLVNDAGGYAVGVAGDERVRGRMDEEKRKRLINAGAGMIITDFSEAEKLLRLFGITG